MRTRFLLLLLSAAVLLGNVSTGLAEVPTCEWNANQLFDLCETEGLVLSADKSALQLAFGTVVEDDGPAAGYSYLPNLETLDGKKLVRKILVADRVPARAAAILAAGGGDLEFRLNGKPLAVLRTRQLGPYWQAYEFDPALLRKGENEIIAAGKGKLWIARNEDFANGSLTRKQHPNRSAKSTDGGRSWNDEALGDRGNADGEYCLRLALDQFQPQGRLTTPVLDTGNLSSKFVGRPLADWGSVELKVDRSSQAAGECGVRVRSGETAVPGRDWTEWKSVSLSPDGAAALQDLKGRFFQVSCTLRSLDPLKSPRLQKLSLKSSPKFAGDWTDRLQVIAADNPPIKRSSIEFRYENSQHPLLKKLRRDYDLDQLAAGAESEFEVITRLARWSSSRWAKRGHLGEAYPPWNALEILKDHADGTPVGGFCQQYNLVFLQACQSLGIPARMVSIGPSVFTDRIRSGHETVEVWSNDYQKWVYVDGNTAWYFTDPKTNIPLSLWELRQAQLDAFDKKPTPAPRLVKLAETRSTWEGLGSFPAFLELRLVPRSNFLSQAAPLPVNQGMRGWFWTGYRVWSDERLPARDIYPHRIFKRGNFEWPVNCVHFVLEPLETAGTHQSACGCGNAQSENRVGPHRERTCEGRRLRVRLAVASRPKPARIDAHQPIRPERADQFNRTPIRSLNTQNAVRVLGCGSEFLKRNRLAGNSRAPGAVGLAVFARVSKNAWDLRAKTPHSSRRSSQLWEIISKGSLASEKSGRRRLLWLSVS